MSIYCDLEQRGNQLRCRRCRARYPIPEVMPLRVVCRKAPAVQSTPAPQKPGCCGDGGKKEQATADVMAQRWSFAKQLKEGAKSAAAMAADGFATVPHEQYLGRMVVCQACPHFSPSGRCLACGCYVKAVKARMRSMHCPLGKWPGDLPPQ